MDITILTAGSRGDTQPYIALALGLLQAGHSVRLAGSKNFEAFVRSYGLDFYPIRADYFEIFTSNNSRSSLLWDFLYNNFRTGGPLEHMQDDLWQACQGTEAIFYHPILPNGFYIARHLGVPSFLTMPYPMSPTHARAMAPFYGGPRLGGLFNLFTYQLFHQGLWQVLRPSVQKFWRRQLGSSPAPFTGPFRQQHTEQQPVLHAYSPSVFPRPADWPDYIHITGYWFLDTPSTWQPPTELVDFLENGPPPVYVGFGSMGNPSLAGETTEIVLKALAQSGQRGVLASGWNGFRTDLPLPETVLMVKDVPHSWLFPRVRAVVHHGGAGTTAAGLLAGVPSVIVPHLADQSAWGFRLSELGVGETPIPRKQLSAGRLATAILKAIQDEEMQACAAALGERIRAENGVARAVEVFHQYTHQHATATTAKGKTPLRKRK